MMKRQSQRRHLRNTATIGVLSSARFRSTRLMANARSRLKSSRGDVPGWVLVTVMTAGLVTALWLIADSELKTILARALAAVAVR